jgi:hypothetical protein
MPSKKSKKRLLKFWEYPDRLSSLKFVFGWVASALRLRFPCLRSIKSRAAQDPRAVERIGAFLRGAFDDCPGNTVCSVNNYRNYPFPLSFIIWVPAHKGLVAKRAPVEPGPALGDLKIPAPYVRAPIARLRTDPVP